VWRDHAGYAHTPFSEFHYVERRTFDGSPRRIHASDERCRGQFINASPICSGIVQPSIAPGNLCCHLTQTMLLVWVGRTVRPSHMLQSRVEHGVRAPDMHGRTTYYTGRKQWLPDIVVGDAKDEIDVNGTIEAYNVTS